MPRYPEGQDSFGKFTLIVDRVGEEEQCCVCGEPMILKLEWHIPGFKLPKGIDVSRTIIHEENVAIGITCGCYAKFHRQVAHIEDAMKASKQ